VLNEAGRGELLPYAIRMREVFNKNENKLTRRVTHLHCSLPGDLDVLFGTLKQRYTVRNVQQDLGGPQRKTVAILKTRSSVALNINIALLSRDKPRVSEIFNSITSASVGICLCLN
jgi:hypothetical protein